ncbi:MAG: orotate phosphoribosyltransferase [Acidobacteria bacterium]|nr:orotate phosphoribosyltransferase [Acidobacteriota bacterium]
MNEADVKAHFEATGALLQGHFKLSSGLHSDRYLQCAKVLQWPERALALGQALGKLLAPFQPRAVISPAMGGIIIGHETGRALGIRALFAERTDGAFSLRRGFALEKGERVVVVEDVVTTGQSTKEILELVTSSGAEPVAAGAIVDRRGEKKTHLVGGIPFLALLPFEIPTWSPEDCPLCQAGRTIIAPGSRYTRPA